MFSGCTRLLLVVTLLISWTTFVQTGTADAEGSPKKTIKRKAGLTSERTYRKLKRAHSLLEQNEYKDAFIVLEKLSKRVQKKPFELAQVKQAQGFAYLQQSQYKQAITALERSLALKALPAGPTISTMFTVAQLKMQLADFRGAIANLKEWFDYVAEPAPTAYITLGTAYAELKDYKSAIPPVKKAISISKRPKEQWYQLLLALYYDQKKYRESAGVLQQLIERFPTESKYWHQLSSMYLSLDDTSKALAILELAYKQGFVKEEKEIVNLANLFLYEKTPFKAAKLLQAAIDKRQIKSTEKNWELLSTAWTQAQETEKAITATERAASLSKDGNLYVRLGQLYGDQEDWQRSLGAYKKAMAKGKVKHPGHAHLALGIAQFNLNNQDAAIAEFQQARRIKKTKEQASRWIAYVRDTQKVHN